jgi:Ca2+-binding EF-hand superfamily protein
MKRAIVGTFALTLAAGFVSAQNAATPATPAIPSQGASASVDFKSIDTNSDGKLSSAEVQSNMELRSAFATLDADRDTYLSQSEYAKWNKDSKPATPAVPATPSPSSSSPEMKPQGTDSEK